LPRRLIKAITDPETRLFVSAVTAWEYADLQKRGRLVVGEDIPHLQDLYGFEVLDFPSSAWRIAARLPRIHGDPVDRMLVAHAIVAELTIVTADRQLRRYPVDTLW
jgi:PIN domain nuclease of toxin-antitoxin system